MDQIQLIPEWRLIPFVERKPSFVHLVWSIDAGLMPYAQLSFTSYFSLRMETVPKSESVLFIPTKENEGVRPLIVGFPTTALLSTLATFEKSDMKMAFSVLVPHYANFHRRALQRQSLEGAWTVERYYKEATDQVVEVLRRFNSMNFALFDKVTEPLAAFRDRGHKVNMFSVCGGLDPHFAAKLILMSHNQSGAS